MSSDDRVASVDEEVGTVSIGRPHVVILGSGASRAAFPEGERSGKQLPLMADFTKIVPVANILNRIPDLPHNDNFEVVYSAISKLPQHRNICLELESAIYAYFDSLKLPDSPTIYDHLILSLREKDVIATFNWDPFLIQAAVRTSIFNKKMPRLLFLHGNVFSGYCEKDKILGVKGRACSKCRQPFKQSKLLFPVAKKDYSSDPAIAVDWKELRAALKAAFMVTIFGYSAPVSDVDAKALLKRAWGSWRKRDLEQFEFIDVKSDEELTGLWKDFIHSHHYDVHNDFYDSWIANHPRRTGEAWWNQYFEVKFINNNPLPKTAEFRELYGWFEGLIKAEQSAKKD